jgi:predicted TIM-barrel fold metal-dependent hydrolase
MGWARRRGGGVDIEDLAIVDGHQHLWDLDRFELPWLANDGVEAIRRTYLMEDYLGATQGANVVKTVYMEVNVHPSQQIFEAETVLDLCGRDDNPMCGAILGGRPGAEDFGRMAERFGESPYVKGFRTVLHDADRPAGMCLERPFVKSMKLLGELGLCFDLCMRPGEIEDGVRLVDQCPETRFVVDHCGGMGVIERETSLCETWMKGMVEMGKRDNATCKISGIVATANEGWSPADLEPTIAFCHEAFGEDRVFFGGDWPVCTLRASFRQWVDALKWIVRDESPAFLSKLFHDNAMRIYQLDEES